MTSPDYEHGRFTLKRQFVKDGINVSEDKIKSYCNEGGYDEQVVRTKINDDIMFRWFFVKDPIRQNFYELLFLDFVKEINGISNAEKPSPVLQLYEGEILSTEEIKKRNIYPPCKSIDFSWKYKNNDFYVYHKYAKDSGGHQDNQYQDLQCFIEEANKVKIQNTFFLAVADGEFWNTMNGKARMTKIERLRTLVNNTTVFALQSSDLITLLGNITNNETT